ncbi:MAG: MoaD/ThiS family protein [Proteobacteria bacterium]|nr:MoaD/ThiS family protein [Pseudomonadota bacterium]MCP4918796.1 MoaD/ThiS family protein [Pseudomonadota bacterium]
MPTVTVRYFAQLREQRGCNDEVVAIPDGSNVAQAYAHLFPPSPEGALPVGYAVNHELVRPTHVLVEGDELALIPPVGGG